MAASAGLDRRRLLALAALAPMAKVWAGAQLEEPLVDSVRTALSAAVHNSAPPVPEFLDQALRARYEDWLGANDKRLAARMPEASSRQDFLSTVWYEAKRAGLDVALVLGVVQVESAFRKFAVSRVGARGFMQVMPFWVGLTEQELQPQTSELRSREMERIRERDRERGGGISKYSVKLLHLQTNIRFGCVILRHYLDLERENFIKALGRYNGNMQENSYANKVLMKTVEWTAKRNKD